MSFCFYPKLEQSCPNVSHCPHLGGAALGTLVHRANGNEVYLRQLHETIDAERERSSRLLAENQRLQRELDEVKLELRLERQNKFATNQQKGDEISDTSQPASSSSATAQGKKRGAPVGHPGWFREIPREYDWAIDVPPMKRCPHCTGQVTVAPAFDPSEHLQEDLINGQYRVVLYRHPSARSSDISYFRRPERAASAPRAPLSQRLVPRSDVGVCASAFP